MVEGPVGSPPGDDAPYWKQRIEDYFNSPQAQRYFFDFFEGLASQARFTLEDFKNRESRRNSVSYRKGELPERVSAGQALTCQVQGHKWSPWEIDNDKFVLTQECDRCHIVRQQTQQDRGLMQMNEFPNISTLPDITEVEEEVEGDPSLICIWCGTVCEDLNALGTHEDECEPA